MQHADQAAGELAQGGMLAGRRGRGGGRSSRGQHAESLLMERIGELTVAHMPGEHGLLLAGRAGSRLVPA